MPFYFSPRYTPTDLTLSNSYIADDHVVGTIIGSFSSIDLNRDDRFSYSLVTGIGDTDNALFTIQNNQLQTTAPLNYNPNNRYSIRVRTTDNTGLFFEKVLTIYVTDVVVSVVASDANAAETASNATPNPAIFTLSRRGDTNEALTVNYTLGGAATNGTDYSTLPTSVTFAAGSSTATVTVEPIDDLLTEADKIVSLNLSHGNGYAVGTNNTAHAIIADNDRSASFPLIALGAGYAPQISGNNVVWYGYDGADYEIYFWDGSTVTQLTNNSSNDSSWQISGNNVVWRGNDGTDPEIYFWDGSTVTQLTNNSTYDLSPQISGHNVVWWGNDGTNTGIYFWDGSTVTQVANNVYSIYFSSLQISGNNVVWRGYDGTDNEIYFWDGSTVTNISNNSTDDDDPRISGNNVVWSGHDGTDYEIYFWNDSTATNISNNSIDDYVPQISGNKVVWYGYDGRDYEIYFWDGSTVTRLTNNSTNDSSAHISGNNVVWQGYGDIYVWNGSTIKGFSNNATDFSALQISGDNVVWRGNDGNIYLATFSNELFDPTLSNNIIAENQAIGTVIGDFSHTSPVAGDTFTYSLVAGMEGTDNTLFTLENNQLQTNAIFDYETRNSYSIRVRTAYQSGLFFERVLSVNVTDVVEPIITVVVSDANAAETAENAPLNPAIFTLSRTGDTSQALTVNHTLTGTATNGADYRTVPTSVTFAAGSTTATVTVNPIDDFFPEADETVSLTLSRSNGYTLGTNNTASATIANDRDVYFTVAGRAPRISDNNVVWQSYDGTDYEIYFWDGSTVTQITNNSTDDSSPQISGDNVVWQGNDGTDNEIYFWNGTTSTVTPITNNFTNDSSPQISGNNVVWQGNDGTDYEIYFWDGSTVTPITNNSTDDNSPQISGNNVVWQGSNGNDHEIYFWDGSTVTNISNRPTIYDISPQISGNNVVWQGISGNGGLFFWNGSTVTQLAFRTFSGSPDSQQISGNNVVWTTHVRMGIISLTFWNGSTYKNLDLGFSVDSPQISGNNVVWERSSDIYFWDGSTVTNISINNSTYDSNPQISGSNVVWQSRDGNIYLAPLTKTLETVGNTSLTQGINNRLYAHNNSIGTVPINNVTNTAPLTVGLYPDWQVLAAATVNGVNKLLWKNIPGNYLHFWTLDSSWHRLTSGGRWRLNSPEALGLENQFQMDLNGDNLVGIESAGNTFLLKDNQNQLHSQTNQVTTALYNPDSTPLTVSPDDNWQALAVETTGNTTQLLWKSPSNNLLRLGTLDNNGQHTTNLEEWATDSPEALALESQFQIDLNGDDLIGSPDPIIDNLGNTSLIRLGINQLHASTIAGDTLIGSLDGTPLREGQYEDWQALAAETVNGVNQILWENLSGNFFHLWNQNWNWQHVSSIGQWDVNAPEILGLESQFQRDLNGDGVIASPPPVNGG